MIAANRRETPPWDEKRCAMPGCSERRYMSPAGYSKGICSRHRAAQRRAANVTARRTDYYIRDAQEAVRRCSVDGCSESRVVPRSVCHTHWLARRRELTAADPDAAEKRRAYARSYRTSQPYREAKKRHRQRHPEQYREANARWRERNRERLLAARRAAYAELRAAGVAAEDAAARR